jgi:chromosome segregation and condensation protein ScpB
VTKMLPAFSYSTKHRLRHVSGSQSERKQTSRKITALFNTYKDRDKEIEVVGEWLFVTIQTAHGPDHWVYPA